MRSARLHSLAILVVLVGSLGAAEAGKIIFHWVDKQGNLHLTDVLTEVPEPYYSMYAAKLRELEEKKTQREGAAKPAASAATSRAAKGKSSSGSDPDRASERPSAIQEQARLRKKWKALIARWRQRLEKTTAELHQAEQGLAQARLNPVLRETPSGRAEVQRWEAARQKALARVEEARQKLLVDLPKQARREFVPPKWLE